MWSLSGEKYNGGSSTTVYCIVGVLVFCQIYYKPSPNYKKRIIPKNTKKIILEKTYRKISISIYPKYK